MFKFGNQLVLGVYHLAFFWCIGIYLGSILAASAKKENVIVIIWENNNYKEGCRVDTWT